MERKEERPADELALEIDGLMRASEFEWTWKNPFNLCCHNGVSSITLSKMRLLG